MLLRLPSLFSAPKRWGLDYREDGVDMDLPPYSKHSHAHALAVSGLMLGLPQERIDREIVEDTGLDPEVIRAEINRGDFDRNAMKFLVMFDQSHRSILARSAAANIASSLNLT